MFISEGDVLIMYPFVPLVQEYRGNLCDLTHFGYICIVDENSNVLFQAGDPEAAVFYRSSSKPIQALPVIQEGLVRKYGLTQEESVIFSGSHAGEPFHIAVLESILEKTELSEDMLCIKPTTPASPIANEERIRQGLPPRRLYHCCSGKHLGLMLLQRELGGECRDYWREDSLVQKRVLKAVREISETEDIQIGVDGCGVPVFACSMRHFAAAYKNLVCPDHILDPELARTAAEYIPLIHKYPLMMRGTNYLCSLINLDPNLLGKGGANGSYGFALKKERIGVSIKMADGTEQCWPLLILEILRFLGCLTPETEQRLLSLKPYTIYNDNDLIVGRREPVFRF